jgi:hypothetical protein
MSKNREGVQGGAFEGNRFHGLEKKLGSLREELASRRSVANGSATTKPDKDAKRAAATRVKQLENQIKQLEDKMKREKAREMNGNEPSSENPGLRPRAVETRVALGAVVRNTVVQKPLRKPEVILPELESSKQEAQTMLENQIDPSLAHLACLEQWHKQNVEELKATFARTQEEPSTENYQALEGAKGTIRTIKDELLKKKSTFLDFCAQMLPLRQELKDQGQEWPKDMEKWPEMLDILEDVLEQRRAMEKALELLLAIDGMRADHKALQSHERLKKNLLAGKIAELDGQLIVLGQQYPALARLDKRALESNLELEIGSDARFHEFFTPSKAAIEKCLEKFPGLKTGEVVQTEGAGEQTMDKPTAIGKKNEGEQEHEKGTADEAGEAGEAPEQIEPGLQNDLLGGQEFQLPTIERLAVALAELELTDASSHLELSSLSRRLTIILQLIPDPDDLASTDINFNTINLRSHNRSSQRLETEENIGYKVDVLLKNIRSRWSKKNASGIRNLQAESIAESAEKLRELRALIGQHLDLLNTKLTTTPEQVITPDKPPVTEVKPSAEEKPAPTKKPFENTLSLREVIQDALRANTEHLNRQQELAALIDSELDQKREALDELDAEIQQKERVTRELVANTLALTTKAENAEARAKEAEITLARLRSLLAK